MLTLFVAHGAIAEDWLRFRGPQGSGVSTQPYETPVEFGDHKNLLWKIELPGPGASSPIIVGDRVIVTCYSGYGVDRESIGRMQDLQRHVVCLDKSNGERLWQKDFPAVLPEDEFSGVGVPRHGYASSTPTSDGKHLFVFFGKSGVISLDLDGNELWRKSVGTGSGEKHWGSGASPIVHDGVLIVNASDEDAALIGLAADTGELLWKKQGVENVWGTPIVVGQNDSATLLFAPPREIWGLDPTTGATRWYTTNGVEDTTVSASPVLSGDLAIVVGGRSRSAVAIRTGADNGADVTQTHTVWERVGSANIATPVVYQQHLYYFAHGVAYCQSVATGQPIFRERLPLDRTRRRDRRSAGSYASPVIADGKIYHITQSGICYVLAAEPEFKLLATNRFESDESEFNATPAISQGRLFMRSNTTLYCVSS